MFTQYLQSIDAIALYPMISLILFFTVFIGAVVWALKADSQYVREMERLPLDEPSGKCE
jgi:cytochrome c oxidase cbb3-type subunit IV